MVPGMTERERLAVDSQRMEWLAEALVGPTHKPNVQMQRAGPSERQLPAIWQRRRCFPSVRELRQLASLARMKALTPLLARVPTE